MIHHHDPNLDELYWHSDLPVARIADLVGLPARNLHRRVTPLEAGVSCVRCGAALTHDSRAALDGWWLHCRACGTSRRNPRARDDQSPARPLTVGGTVLVRERRDIGIPVEACVDALVRAGVAWDEQSLIVLDAEASDPVTDELREWAPGVLAVPSLATLGGSQTERLQALFVLTRMSWRVIAADDIGGLRRVEPLTSVALDHLDDPYRSHDPWSPTWAEHLIESTSRSERAKSVHRRWPTADASPWYSDVLE